MLSEYGERQIDKLLAFLRIKQSCGLWSDTNAAGACARNKDVCAQLAS